MSRVFARRILVVDNDADAARSMAMVLSLDGHDVRVAHDGHSTLTTALAFRPQLVFLDIGMPGMDGYETAAQLRRLRGLEDTLVIALTGFGQDSHHLALKEARFDHYLTKPVQFAAVRRIIVEHRPPS